MMSESNKQQAVNKLTEIVANFTAMISTRMPDDVVDKLKQLKDAETSSMGKIIYHTMFDNMQKAIDLNRPACQDTGEIMFFVKVGSRFPLLGELQSILKQAVEEATVKAPLRHNAVEIFDEVNTGKNTGSGVPWVTGTSSPTMTMRKSKFTWQAAAARYPPLESVNAVRRLRRRGEIRLRKYLHPRRKRLSTGTGGRGHRHLGGNRRRTLA